MDLHAKYALGLPYKSFLEKYGTALQKDRWQQAFAAMSLTPAQKELLSGFKRKMKVLCLAGAWCGDCSGQCPAFEHFALAAPVIQVHYLDRDEHADVQKELQINGGNRVPVLVFLSEDGFEVARYGERTLTKYRQLITQAGGAACPTGILTPSDTGLLAGIVQDWLNEFERVQWILRLSARLRQIHGD